MKFIIGKKLNMTQTWQGEEVVAVTRIQAGPCTVVQVKNKAKDGYESLQLGFGSRQEKNIKKPQRGHMKNLGNFQALREFRTEKIDIKKGDVIDVSTFAPGDIVKVTGKSKGRGFQGVVKRHGFAGGRKTHGNKDQLRMPGSVGATQPKHVFKGTRMGGHMGDAQISTANLEVIDIDKENNILSVKGAVPGARNGLLLIVGKGDLKIRENKKEEVAEEAVNVKESEKTEENK